MIKTNYQNPWASVMYLHNQCAALVTGSFVVAAVGALYALRLKYAEQASLFLKTGAWVGLCCCLPVAFFPNKTKLVATNRYNEKCARGVILIFYPDARNRQAFDSPCGLRREKCGE
jgi:cytochrome bd-type quinol oxidase subunit 1